MEWISPLMSVERIPLIFPHKPWFQDHCLHGRIVLPAVETMLLLAARVVETHPEVDIRVMEDVRFAKFLEIPPEAAIVASLVECDADSDGRVQITLLSRLQCGAMSRMKEHGRIFFSPSEGGTRPAPSLDPAPPTRPLTEVKVEQLYLELVPFGPNYQTLQDTLYLAEHCAWGRLKAPSLPADPVQDIIGSPFPLDGALHAACVLGRQSVDFLPFPVGFARRVIHRPTQAGCSYGTRVIQLSQSDEELVFDLAIFDSKGQVYETVSALRMRNVAGAMER